jgi:membrane protease YdiL (CAAX protease family)
MKPFAWQRDGLVLAAAMLAPSSLTWLYFITLAGQGTVTQSIYLGSKVVLGLLPLAWWWCNKDRTWASTDQTVEKRFPAARNRTGHRAGIWYGTLFGLLTFLAIVTLYFQFLKGSPALVGTAEAVEAKLADAGVHGVASFLALAGFLSVLHAAFEEYYWRWFVFGRLRQGIHWLGSAVVAALAFALHHVIVLGAYLPITQVWLTAGLSLGIAFGGLTWSVIYQFTGSLLGAWIAHVFADLGIMWCGYDLCQRYFS